MNVVASHASANRARFAIKSYTVTVSSRLISTGCAQRLAGWLGGVARL